MRYPKPRLVQDSCSDANATSLPILHVDLSSQSKHRPLVITSKIWTTTSGRISTQPMYRKSQCQVESKSATDPTLAPNPTASHPGHPFHMVHQRCLTSKRCRPTERSHLQLPTPLALQSHLHTHEQVCPGMSKSQVRDAPRDHIIIIIHCIRALSRIPTRQSTYRRRTQSSWP